MSWTEMQPVLADRLNGLIESKPEVLLEHDGGPWGLKADIILAVLYGMDGQVDATWRIPRVEEYLLRPVMAPIHTAMRGLDDDPTTSPAMPNVARYVLQSTWAETTLDWTRLHNLLPADVHPAPGTSDIKLALLRYRHRI